MLRLYLIILPLLLMHCAGIGTVQTCSTDRTDLDKVISVVPIRDVNSEIIINKEDATIIKGQGVRLTGANLSTDDLQISISNSEVTNQQVNSALPVSVGELVSILLFFEISPELIIKTLRDAVYHGALNAEIILE